MTFTRPAAEISQIEAFIISKDGVTPFYWKTPEGVVKTFKCEPEFQKTYTESEWHQLKLKFTEVFERP